MSIRGPARCLDYLGPRVQALLTLQEGEAFNELLNLKSLFQLTSIFTHLFIY